MNARQRRHERRLALRLSRNGALVRFTAWGERRRGQVFGAWQTGNVSYVLLPRREFPGGADFHRVRLHHVRRP